MDETLFRSAMDADSVKIEKSRSLAFSLHENVGQNYGQYHPYSFHLQMVVDIVVKYGHLVCDSRNDVLPMIFGAYFHDTIEDTRHTYNDIYRMALQDVGMTVPQAMTAAEIVYALTDEKGRNRAERQSEKYYQGIRVTPYAPLVKMADRLANMTFSFTEKDASNVRMKDVYRSEFPDFLAHISRPTGRQVLSVPSALIEEMIALLK